MMIDLSSVSYEQRRQIEKQFVVKMLKALQRGSYAIPPFLDGFIEGYFPEIREKDDT